MSVAFSDYDGDGFIDAFVTNDKLPNFLFRNLGNGSFRESALLSGSALPDHANPVSSMGVDFRDYDNDGRPDITVTALAGETFPLFHNEKGAYFRDLTHLSGIGTSTIRLSGWGNGFVWKDLFTTNSHVDDQIEIFEATQYKQSNSIFVNLGAGRFIDVSSTVGQEFQIRRAHRGCAFGDFDNDGKMDVVVTALGEPAELWQNVSRSSYNWIVLKLVGTRSNRDGIGAVVELQDQWNLMTTSVGYASSSHSGVHFGLGKVDKIENIRIRWPSGRLQSLRNPAVNQVLWVNESEGEH
jgi:hypothetical protein